MSFLKGRQHLVDRTVQERYGDFVRDGPDSLLISDIAAFKTIYGFNGKFGKGDFYAITSNGKPDHPNLFAAPTENQHREIKKKLVASAVSHQLT
jgi:hypothetical protein